MPANQTNSEFRQLLIGLVDGQLDAPGLRRFEEILTASPELQRFYDEFMTLHGMLLWRAGPPLSPVGSDEIDQIAKIRFQTNDAPASPPCGFIGTVWQGAAGFFANHEFALPYTVAVLLIGIAMLFGSMVHISRDMRFVENDPARTGPMDDGETLFVGQITDMKDCRWADPDTSTIVGAHVALKRKYSLSSGLLEITYRSGARVILEGPCEYTADSAVGGYLKQGKLVARVKMTKERREEGGEKSGGPAASAASAKPQAANPQSSAPLFTVSTPTALITDLGTEFGVEVDEDGNTASCVFRGSVKVQTVGDERQKEIVLGVDESARVTKDEKAGKLKLTALGEASPLPSFVRRMTEPPKLIDLLDIVAGGNGLRKGRERGIDPATGQQDPFFMITEYASDGEYRSVAFNKLIDGVFVPVANGLNVRIDSAGHTYDGFGRNAGKTVGSIWARSTDVSRYNNERNRFDWVYSIGGGEFMPEQRGLLCLHANAGITFDLAAMRKSYPDTRPKLFRSTAGMGDTSGVHPDTDPYSVDFRVFVDGVVKYERKAHTRPDGVLKIKVELGPEARFLTLAVTDNDGRCAYDWSVFGDPVLEMAPVGNTKKQGVELPKGGRRSD